MAKNTKKKEIEVKTVTETITPSEDDLILGATKEVKTVKVVNYTSVDRLYQVTNLQRKRTYQLNGIQIGAILGMNQSARDDLKHGKKKTTISKLEKGQNIELYKIEVID